VVRLRKSGENLVIIAKTVFQLVIYKLRLLAKMLNLQSLLLSLNKIVMKMNEAVTLIAPHIIPKQLLIKSE
jgi:hypothetical protein